MVPLDASSRAPNRLTRPAVSFCVCASQATWAALPDDTAPLQYAASVLAEARGEAVDEDGQLVNVAVRAMADHCRTRAAADWEVRPRDTPAACGHASC